MFRLYCFHHNIQNAQQQAVYFYMQPVLMHNEDDLFLQAPSISLQRFITRMKLFGDKNFGDKNAGDDFFFEKYQ